MAILFDTDSKQLEGLVEFNQAVRNWTAGERMALRAMIQSLGIGVTGKLLRSVQAQALETRDTPGMVGRVLFKFPKEGVYVVKGVGRGYKIESIRGNGAVLQVAGLKKRIPKDWFNPVIERGLDTLTQIAADGYADISAKNIFIK